MQSRNFLSIKITYNGKFNRYDYEAYRLYQVDNTPRMASSYCHKLEDALREVEIDKGDVQSIVDAFNNKKISEGTFMVKLAEGKEPVIS